MTNRTQLSLAALALAVALLAGCSTTPTARTDARPVPSDRLLSFQNAAPDRSATIVVTRDEGLMGGGCYASVWINGTIAARVDQAETAAFRVAPGDYVLRMGRDPQGRSLCAVQQDQYTDRETVMHANETKRFRLFTDANGTFDVKRGE